MMNPTFKRYIISIVVLDRVVVKRALSNEQIEIFCWLAKESVRDAVKFVSLHGERSSELLVGKAIRFRICDPLALTRFANALQRRRRQG